MSELNLSRPFVVLSKLRNADMISDQELAKYRGLAGLLFDSLLSSGSRSESYFLEVEGV